MSNKFTVKIEWIYIGDDSPLYLNKFVPKYKKKGLFSFLYRWKSFYDFMDGESELEEVWFPYLSDAKDYIERKFGEDVFEGCTVKVE